MASPVKAAAQPSSLRASAVTFSPAAALGVSYGPAAASPERDESQGAVAAPGRWRQESDARSTAASGGRAVPSSRHPRAPGTENYYVALACEHDGAEGPPAHVPPLGPCAVAVAGTKVTETNRTRAELGSTEYVVDAVAARTKDG